MSDNAAELKDLVRETSAMIGAELPGVMDASAPVLSDTAIDEAARGLYWVGLIGGKEVGKSALVNALAGQEITRVSDTGEGTSLAVAYFHVDAAGEVIRTLESTAPGRYQPVPHRIDHLRRQVLLDLPDIDSHHRSHLQLTRSMLRHLLYPLWIASEEKYADKTARDILRQVAEGNDPSNFLFVLNKVDLRTETEAAEIRDDFARRIASALGIAPPKVFAVSALNPNRYDLPELRRLLTVSRNVEDVAAAARRAADRREQTLARWLIDQQLPALAAAAARVADDCNRRLIASVITPLLDESIPAIADDPAVAARTAEEALDHRVQRWPVVRLVHELLGPPLALATAMLRRGGLAAGDERQAISRHLRLDGRDLDLRLGGVLAGLRKQHPQLAEIYRDDADRLWRDDAAADAARTLEHRLSRTLADQRVRLIDRFRSPGGIAPAFGRWLVTIGAALWFPIIQPFAQIALADGFSVAARDVLSLLVSVFSSTYLLSSVAFLAIYFLVLWLWLRWDTQRKVRRLLAGTHGSADEGLAGQTVNWGESLLAPVTEHRDRIASLADRVTDACSRFLPPAP